MTIEYRPDEFAEAKHSVPSWVFSAMLHAALLLMLTFLLSQNPRGAEDKADRAIGIAVAHRMPDRTQYDPVLQSKDTADASDSTQQTGETGLTESAVDARNAESPLDLSGLLAASLDTPLPDGIPGDGEAISAAARSTGDATMKLGPSGSKHTTEVFGISGTGSRFLYVFDRSESMNGFGGRPLLAAKTQMIASIRTLTPEQEFQIVFYNTEPRAFIASGQIVRLLEGDDFNKQAAERYIRAMTAFGGTRHMSALLLALRMSPDVIFFLTDARVPRMTGVQLQEIKIRAQRSSTTIHAIEFGDDLEAPGDSFLRALASDNGGQYRYLHVGALDP